MRIDSHHHFWQLDRFRYPWMTPDLVPLLRSFGPDELQPLLARHGFDRSVLVQTISSLDETRWFLQLADEHDWIAGVVGWVDLTDPALAETLDQFAAHPKFVGVRHQVHDEVDDRWLVRDDVLRGLAGLAARSIPYDLLLRPQHLPCAIEVARRLPQLTLAVDHIAKPAIARRGWDDWATPIAELAALPNVTCKLSGMITEANWTNWQNDDLRPYVNRVLDCFGPARLMFGSDWPVCLLAGSYAQVVEALDRNLESLSSSEKEQLFGQTAARVYGLQSR
jgi:L-fuconolactonase